MLMTFGTFKNQIKVNFDNLTNKRIISCQWYPNDKDNPENIFKVNS